jgi:tRNA wybutosine-synthesizing protein 1
MQNVPWHKEVCLYGEKICELLKKRQQSVVYEIATEHEHSCCILLARVDKFKIDNAWYTWIDYDKFNFLIDKYYASNGTEKFTSLDYIAKTPEWALYESQAKGFDPVENRWKKNKNGVVVEIEYKASGSGCG